MLTIALTVLCAVIADRLLGEPKRWHPLVGFGSLTNRVEQLFYGNSVRPDHHRRMRGLFAVALLVLPFTAITAILITLPYVGTVIGAGLLYLCLGHKSLQDHARPVSAALQQNDERTARRLASYMVSRDPDALDTIAATTESVLENGSDSVFGTLFWFVVAGAPGVVFYRLINTLDAMWGYRNERYIQFGWAAARLDDLSNYVPARLTAITYALLGNTRQALHCWRLQASSWDSPNAGPVMASGAGALGITLGGPARYLGIWHQRPLLGCGPAPQIADIEGALQLVGKGVWLWLGALLILGGLHYA